MPAFQSKWDKWRNLPKRHVIRKRVASSIVRIEPKPDSKYLKDRSRPSEYCMACQQLASFLVYFQKDGCRILERYCSECLDKYIIFEPSLISKQ